jgi:hypothetical protein
MLRHPAAGELRMCSFWAGGISSFPFTRAREYRATTNWINVITRFRHYCFELKVLYFFWDKPRKSHAIMAMRTSQCFLKEIDSNSCGISRDIRRLVLLCDCNDDIQRHLASFRLSKSNLNECDLILARVGMFDVSQQEKEQFLVCPYHRHKFGKFRRP